MDPLAAPPALSPEPGQKRYWNKNRTMLKLRLSTGGAGRSMARAAALV